MVPNVVMFFNVSAIDVVTQLENYVNTVRCLKPEELNVKLITPLNKKVLNFEYDVKDCMKFMPIKLENNNNMDISIMIRIIQVIFSSFGIQ